MNKLELHRNLHLSPCYLLYCASHSCLLDCLHYTTTPASKVLLVISSDGVKARGAKAKAKAVVHKAKAKAHKAKDKVINRDQGLRQGHDEPTQYHFR